MASTDPKQTILIADADAAFRSFLSGLLRPRLGLHVVTAKGDWDVWPLVEQQPIDLFVIDAQVPNIGGFALVEELRRRRIRTPILFVASDWQEHEAYGRLTTQLGVQRVIHKPFSAYQFIMEVESTLEAPQAMMHASEPPPAPGSVPRRLVSEPAMAALPAVRPSLNVGAFTFLLIGRDAGLAEALQTAAEGALVSLVCAPDAASAITLLERREADGALVLLDTHDADVGFAEATELLCSPRGKRLPLGFVSAEADVPTRMNAVQAGGIVHLTRPFRAQDLHHAVTAMTQARRPDPPRLMVVADPARGAQLSLVLCKAEMHVDAIGDAYTLLEHLHVATPDLLLFDIDLPGVSGLDVCKLLRASPSWRGLPLVLISTQRTSEARIAAFDAGADDFLVKPLNEEELVARIEARIRRHRAARESADKDPVTGLLQRHAFVERARAMLAAARRTANTVAFCVLRMDDVARLRAAHDQFTSESIVAGVSRHVAPLFREYDLGARWSDDEFIFALPDVDARMTEALIRRLAGALAAVQVSDAEGRPLRLSFRAGVAAHPDDAHRIPTLVGAARQRLAPVI